MGAPTTGIAPGVSADLVSLETGDPALICRKADALLDSWIFASPRNVVDCVWVGGRKLVVGGRHHRSDTIRASFVRAIEELYD